MCSGRRLYGSVSTDPSIDSILLQRLLHTEWRPPHIRALVTLGLVDRVRHSNELWTDQIVCELLPPRSSPCASSRFPSIGKWDHMINILVSGSVSVRIFPTPQGIGFYCACSIIRTRSEAANQVAPSYGLYHDPETGVHEELVTLFWIDSQVIWLIERAKPFEGSLTHLCHLSSRLPRGCCRHHEW